MDKLHIEKNVDFPEIVMEPSGFIKVSGRSYPEDTLELYAPVLDWMEAYIKSPSQKTVMRFDLDYFNSSSYKVFLNLLLKLETVHKAGDSVIIEWSHKERDIDMKEAGEEFSELVDVPFQIIPR